MFQGLTNAENAPEKGGRLFWRVSTQSYGYEMVANDSASACDYFPVGGYYAPGHVGLAEDNDKLFLGYFHGHPEEDKVMSSTWCHRAPGASVFGVSTQDREVADTLAPLTNANYVVQNDKNHVLSIFTFGSIYDPADPNSRTPVSDHKYTKSGASCAARIN